MLKPIRVISSFFIIVVLLLSGGLFPGHPNVTADKGAEGGGIILQQPFEPPEKGNPKLDSQLNQLATAQASGETVPFALESYGDVSGDVVRVVVECLPGQIDSVTQTVSDYSVIETSYDNLLQMTVPVVDLTALAETPGITLVRMPQHPVLFDVISEGVGIINADDWQAAGFRGAGVKIGIFDLGFADYATRQSQGEVPVPVDTLWSPSIGQGTSTHGTACTEVVYDIAPDAEYYLANASTDVEWGPAVNWLISKGVNVISCSCGFTVVSPGDGTGPICNMVNNARTAGILWSQAIGNSARSHWQGDFYDPEPDGWHNFSGSDWTNAIWVESAQQVGVSLKWDDAWGTASINYDLLLWYDYDGDYVLEYPDDLVASSTFPQDGSGGNDYPRESIPPFTASDTGWYYITIGKASGSDVNLHLYSSHPLTYQVAASSYCIPADSPNAMTVGAVDYSTPTVIEPFSSQGPTEAVSPLIKPDLVAPDGVTSATYNPFYGTSAAAPHAAGAAALVKECYPSYTPAEIQSFLEGRTIDLGDADKDNIYGSGRLDLGEPPVSSGSISGYVYEEDGITTIEGAMVGVFDLYTPLCYGWVPSNADGSYTFGSLATGDYAVRVEAEGYSVEWYDGVLEKLNATPVSVVAPDDTPGINFTLEPGGGILGYVYQSDGLTPVEGAQIDVFGFGSSPAQWFSLETTWTFADGSYETGGLPSGQYAVRVAAEGYATEWYDNTFFYGKATPIYISVPGDIAGIDFSLEPGGTISGTITDDVTGLPVSEVSVLAIPQTQSPGGWLALSDGNGNYTIPGVPYGSYLVQSPAPFASTPGDDGYAIEYWQEALSYHTATLVEVSAGSNPDNIDFALEVGGSISGIVLDQATSQPVIDASSGDIYLDTGWHKFVYRQQEYDGGQASRAAFKTPGDTDWRWFSTSELEIRTAPDAGAESGILLITKKSTWDYPQNHGELVTCVDIDSTEEPGWYGESVVLSVHQDENIHGNDDYYTSYYEGYFYVDTAGTWYFSTDSDDASEIVIDDQVAAAWYGGHGSTSRWDHKMELRLSLYDTHEWVASTRGNADGSYVFNKVHPGTYIVEAASQGYINEWYDDTPVQIEASSVVVVAATETPDIDFYLESYTESGGSISGYVYEEDGITTIEGAIVSAYGATKIVPTVQLWSPDGQATTDSSGHYSITGLTTGDYRVAAVAPNHERIFYNNAHVLGTGDPVTVTEGNDTSPINFSLGPGGTISGIVRNADGSATLPNVSVLASYPSTTPQTASVALTNASGEYTLDGLSYGDYSVYSPFPFGLGSGDNNYIIEVWQEKKSLIEAADMVNVAAGINPTGIDFTLEEGCRISGYVRQEGSGTPIAGAVVFAWEYTPIISGGPGVLRGVGISNTNGFYESSAVPNGTYGLHIQSAPGYATEWWDNTYYQNLATPIEITGPGEITGKDFNLAPGGSISGYVQDSDSNLIANMHVQALDSTNGQFINGVNTNASGDYTISGLPEGSYYVRTCVTCSGTITTPYIDEYYDDAYLQQDAQLVTVTPPGDTPNINFSLELGGTISGHVTATDGGAPIAGAQISVFDYASLISGRWQGFGGTQTDASGNYTLSGLPAGQYGVSVSASGYATEYYDNVFSFRDANPVTVTATQNTPNINFSLELGGTISGRITDNVTGQPLINVSVDAERIDIPIIPCWGASSNQSGYYTISGLPFGQYKVRSPVGWGSGDNGYITEYYDNKESSSLADLVTVSAGSPNVTGIDFTPGIGGTISGHVAATDGGAPIAGAQITIIEYNSLSGSWLHLGWAQTDASGNYTTTGLPTGTYAVQVMVAPFLTEWYNGTYYPNIAEPVPVNAPGNTQNINFTLETGGSISGHVYQADGYTPISNLHVYATDNNTGQWMTGANTNVSGNYTLYLPAGSYYVRTCSSCSGLNYIDKWYNNVFNQNQATPVLVTIPNDTPNINFSLEAIVTRPTIEASIVDGVAWLASQQNPDGSWGTYYKVTKTALAVLKLITHAHDLGVPPLDLQQYEYSSNVSAGLNYLFSRAFITQINPQTAGNPDNNGNGTGVYFYSPDYPPGSHHPYDTYEAGITLMALAADSSFAGMMVNVPGSMVNGWLIEDVVQDTVDYLAWGQTDTGSGRGGWNYVATNNSGPRSDQSNTGWVTLGLMYAEDFGSTVPIFVMNELDFWINYIQADTIGGPDDGGSYYTGPADGMTPLTNILRTGNLLQQMAFVGDNLTTPRVQNALDFMARYWDDTSGRSWIGNPVCYHAAYTAMKGLEQIGAATLGSIDWFADLTGDIMSQQSAGGSWPVSCFDDGDRILSTVWALLTLQKEVPETQILPDLVITDKHEEWVEPGVSYTVHFTVKNQGNASTGSGFQVGINVDGEPQQPISVPTLGVGQTFDGTSGEIALEGDTDTITVCADTDYNIPERFENNNCVTNIWPLPDLIISEKHEEWVVPGVSYKVYFTIKNIGGANVPSGHDVFLSVAIGQTEAMEVPVSLGPGESWSSSFNKIINLTGSVDTLVLVFADMFGEVNELNEWNNTRANSFAWPATPDLTISEKHEEWISDSVYQVYFTVLNQGNTPAAAGHDVSLTVDDTPIETIEIPVDLATGESYSGVFTSEITISSGWDTVTVCADANQEIPESVEWNNCLSSTTAWPEAPDLQVVVPTGENWVDQDTYTVLAFVRNNGNAVAPAGFDVSLSINGILTEVLPVPVDLPPGQTRLVFFTTQINLHGSPDSIMVCADSNQEVNESREDNNCYTVNLPSPPPDLVISEKHEEWVTPGETYKVYFTVKNINQGFATARAGHSASLSIDFGSTIETKVVPVALGPGESWSGSFNTVVTLSQGMDTVIVSADTFAPPVFPIIFESNELNNGRANSISWPEKPDLAIADMYEEWVSDGVYKVHYTIRNDGNGTAAAFHDAALTVDGQFVSSHEVQAALAPGESYSSTFISETTITGGWDTVTVCADVNNEVDEINEFLNCRVDTVAWPAAPDLSILLKFEQWAGEGVYNVSGFVRNNGNAVAPPGSDVSLTVDGNVIATSQLAWPTRPGEIQFFLFTNIQLSGSTDNITVCADANQEVAESREDNNCLTNIWPSLVPELALAVSTSAATGITTTSATLHGSLDILVVYGSADVSFEWGTTYGALDQVTPPVTKTGTGDFSAVIGTLTPNTQYYFRAKATAGGTTVYGNELDFTTPLFDVLRELPAVAAPGSTFTVTITFTAPDDNFNSIVLYDEAPLSWQVAGDESWCTPAAQTKKIYGTSGMEYSWLGPYDEGQTFTAVYLVTVPAGTEEETYAFPDGWLVYYLDGEEHQVDINGDSEILIRIGSTISGFTNQVNCDVLSGATLMLYKDDVLQAETSGNATGEYEILATSTGTYVVVVSKSGFRDESKTINITELGAEYTLNFTGDSGIIPNGMNGVYFAKCMNKYLFGTGNCAFGGIKFAKVMNAYLFGVP